MARAARQGRGTPGGRRPPVPPASSNQPGMLSRRGIAEIWAELRKVQWPTRSQVVQGTIVVAVVSAVFAIYLTAIDAIAVKLVQAVDNLLN